MKPKSKKGEFVITLNNEKQVEKVKLFYCNIKGLYPNMEFAIICHNLPKGRMLYAYIPKEYSHLPVISFEEWEALPDEEFVLPEKESEFNSSKTFKELEKATEFNSKLEIVPVSQLEEVEPKIIGYKFKNKDLLANFELIYNGFVPFNDNFDLLPDNLLKKYLENLGVIELWFNPVYEKESITLESITLKSGVKLSEDDIAEVKEILNNK